MKKLDEIPKKNIFDVPDQYFDQLPGIIQARISEKKSVDRPDHSWAVALRYAVGVLLVGVIGFLWYTGGLPSTGQNVKDDLATIDAGQLVEYLDEHEMATDDLVEKIAWSSEDLDALENSVYSGLDGHRQEIEKILNEYDSEL